MAKTRNSKKGPLLKKALYISGIAVFFLTVVIAGFILYKGKEKPSAHLPPQVVKLEKPQPPLPSRPSVVKARVAIVIDDMGGDVQRLMDILDIKAPVAVAVLPFLSHSREVAEMASASGREVLLHLPMEPKDLKSNDPGKGALFTYMTEEEVASQVKKDIDAVPYIAGINNHMGSKFTEDERLMRVVLNTAKKKNLFFLDSRTTNKSEAYRLAKELDVKTEARQVFLDNEDDMVYIKGQIEELIEMAKKRGSAIAIGHPRPATIAAIQEMIPRINQEDVEVVAVSSLIDSTHE